MHVDRCGTMIEVDPSQVVLIGLAFAAVLADHHARHGLERFARTPDRPTFELRRGNGALTRGGSNAHQILGRILHVDDVAEGTGRSDHDVRVERQSQHVVGRDGVSAADPNQAPEHTEIEQSKCELRLACRHCVKAIQTFSIRRRRQLGVFCDQIDRHTGKNGASLIEYATGDAAL
jgi:hypothetical protein